MDAKVYAISMMRDEADVARHVCLHLAEELVDGIIVADNLSTDCTRAELEAAKAECAGKPSITPNHEPWTRPDSAEPRGKNWKK